MISGPPSEIGWSSPLVEHIVRLVGDRAGLVFSRPRHETIEATIRREASRTGFRDLAAYGEALRTDSAAVDSLAAELTIGETYFFRDPAQFDMLRSEILPGLAAAHRGNEKIRVWSAGCASGEEAYSVAIICHELGIGSRVRIVGTDLSRERLQAAREARYGRWSLRGVPDTVTATYFRRRDTRFDLVGTIREMVDFRYVNLAEIAQPAGEDPSAPAEMDVILCRNVLIYFDAATTARIVTYLVGALKDGGWLLLGASDPPITDYADCEVVITRAGLLYRRSKSPRRDSVVPRATREEIVYVPFPAAGVDLAALAPAHPPDTPSDGPEVSHHEFRPETPQLIGADPMRELLARVVEAHAHGREAEAAELAGQFIDRGGNELSAWIIRIRALANTGSLAAAGQICAAALELHPLSAELAYLQALLLVHAGRYPDAATAARRALYLDRSLAVAHLALGDALARLEPPHAAESARAFRSAHRLLASMDRDAIVPASGGERSGRLTATVAARLTLMESSS